MSVLVIAEKPSVGASIAAVLGASERKDGYREGSGYVVSWCVGHLVGLADADAYGDFGKWRREDLPILPQDWQTVVFDDRRKQFATLKALMERGDIESLVCATDAGREGELIFRYVYEKAGCEKPFKRLWISSMEDAAIRAGFDNLKDGSAYDGLYQSALCRVRADWLIGINATRLYSTLYGKTLSVGRVQSPTLAMLTERAARIAGFVKERYHHVTLDMGGVVARSERIPGAQEAEDIRAAADKKQAACTAVKREQKTAAPPRLFDLTALQREANRLFGYKAIDTLNVAQSLYEKKLLTYPRTDSRYLTSDMEAGIAALVQAAAALIDSGGNFSVSASQVINDGKVTDHHAIVPTAAAGAADVSALPKTERNVLLTVAARLICAVGERHVYEAVVAEFLCGGGTFTAKGKATVTEGWKAAEALFKAALNVKADDDSDADEGGATIPPVTEGQTFEDAKATTSEHFTSPPKPYSDSTLLSAMEAAGAAEATDEAERTGLGTPATRAAVIENLVGRGFAFRKGKQLIPTDDGNALIKALPDALKSPQLTAEWENTLALIAKGAASPDEFMAGIEGLTTQIVREGDEVDPAAARMFSPGREVIGVCPRCGANVHEGKKNFYCANRGCAFVMWRNDRFFEGKRKELTKTIATALLKDGRAKVKGLYSEKSNKTYDAVVLLADTGEKYVNYRLAPREQTGDQGRKG
jgi:DNA topoisomerase-3